MAKRLTLTCLLLFCIAGVKAQVTYCYHIYKKYDKNDIPQSVNGYRYLTFKGDFMYASEKDGGYEISQFDGKPYKNLYRFKKRVDGALLYAQWNDYANNYQDEIYMPWGGHSSGLTYYLVSEDKSKINYIHKGYVGVYGNTITEPFTLCYERCPNRDCEKTNDPSMKH